MPYSIAYDINNADQIVEYSANEMLRSGGERHESLLGVGPWGS